MRKINILILLSIVATIGFAQQFPLQSQYQFNYPTINPAASGENDFYRARASFRDQWHNFSDNPISTQILTVTKGFGDNGLGVTFFNDKTGGAFSKSGAALSYSHRVRIDRSQLAFGVSAGASRINLSSINDPAILTNNDVIPEFIFGVYYTLNNFKLGVSVPGLLNTELNLTESSENILERHFYSMLSYEKRLNDNWTAHPSILVKTTTNHNQFDANINFKLKNRLWFGTSYRQDFGPTVYLGVDLGKILSVYSFDLSTNEISDYSDGSHEFTLGYDFITDSYIARSNITEEAVILKDKDNDGIVDTLDLCPEEYGEAIANGCPDSDKDGIPDKYDLCPHIAGDLKSQGCPHLTQYESEIISIALEDLRFDVNKAIIKNESFESLTNLVVLMHKNPKMMLFIDGHASSEGTALYNLNLSAQRSKAVQLFFIKRGIGKGRLVIDFHGEEDPLNTNSTEEERAENRRVNFAIKYHLVDQFSAYDLKIEYDSLLNIIYGKEDLITKPVEEEQLLQEVIIPDLVNINDSIPVLENDTIIIINEDIDKEIIEEQKELENPAKEIDEKESSEWNPYFNDDK